MIVRRLVLALAFLFATASCAVPTDETAQVIDPETLPEVLRPSGSSSTTTTTGPPAEAVIETVFLLGPRPDSDQRSTVGVERAVEPGATPEDILRTLFGRGGEVPVVTEEEEELDYINALDDFDLHAVEVDDGLAVVDISLIDTVTGEASEETIGRELLADVAAQIVWTSTEIDTIERVLISRDGVGLSLPTRDESGDAGDAAADEPVDRDDYARYDIDFEFPATTTTAPTTAAPPTSTGG